ncbi:MAG: molybdenum cofactor guanylyltransferase [Phycisphaeraceae bacterium]
MRVILGILAGGRSSRFGSSKLQATVNGRPILTWLTDRLSAVSPRQRWLNLAPGQAMPPGPGAGAGAGAFDRIIYDPMRHAGPLAGIAAMLAAVPADALLIVVPADMPLIDPNYVRQMLTTLVGHPQHIVAMGRWTTGPRCGRVEPLPSVWRGRRALALVRQARQVNITGPQQLSHRAGVTCLPLAWPTQRNSFMNINRREDLADLAHASGLNIQAPPQPAK